MTVAGCALCGCLRHVVARGALWTLALNRNQNLLGKAMLVLNDHHESVADLSASEWAALHPEIARATAVLDGLFAPDQYNVAFLMNLDRHVHLHIVPRYEAPREWGGATFPDQHFGGLFGTEQRPLPAAALDVMAAELASRLPSPEEPHATRGASS